jgi:hypothetical protein
MGLFKKKETVPKIPATLSTPAFPSSSPLPPLPPNPSLPPLPPLPSIPTAEEGSIKKELPELPSFPSSSKNENLNQEIVKSAVSDVSPPEENEEKAQIPKSFHRIKAPVDETIGAPKPSIWDSPEPAPLPTEEVKKQAPVIPDVPKHAPSPATPQQKQEEPIFVRIDKFQAAQKNFDEIKSKMEEMELVLKKIKEVRSREEEELKGWTEDVEKLKFRLSEIDSNIFSQL